MHASIAAAEKSEREKSLSRKGFGIKMKKVRIFLKKGVDKGSGG